MSRAYDAVVLAGGAASRLGGADKPAVRVGGRSLLDRVLDAVADAGTVVVVGPRRPTRHEVRWVREVPPGAGPVPALMAGLTQVDAEVVAVLAADLPFLDAPTVRRLVDVVGSSAVDVPAGSGGAGGSGGSGAAGRPAGAVGPAARSALPAGACLVDDTGREQWLAGAWRSGVLREGVQRATTGRLRDVMAPLRPALLAVPGGDAALPPPWYDCDNQDDVDRAEAWS